MGSEGKDPNAARRTLSITGAEDVVLEEGTEATTIVAGEHAGLILDVPMGFSHGPDREQLARGVRLHRDGEEVGRLVQRQHGFLRRNRVLHLQLADPGVDDAIMRLRGVDKMVVERDGRRLVDEPTFGPLRARLAPGAPSILAAVWSLARVRLLKVVTL